jgi:hypothetical protein
MPLGLSHVSLHYDGIRISDALDCSIELFCKKCSDTIKQLTGFRVRILQKVHRSLLENFAHHSRATTVLPGVNPCLLLDGNCIPCAVHHLVGLSEAKLAEIVDPKTPSSILAATRRARSYADTVSGLKVEMVPLMGMQIERPGLYLLHSENLGIPHCVAVRCTEENCTIIDGETQWIVLKSELNACAETAIDRPTIVTYVVSITPIPCPDEKYGPLAVRNLLMQLQAGAGRSDGLDVDCVNDVVCGNEADDDGGVDPFSTDVAQDGAVVNIGDKLLNIMESEVTRTLKMLSKKSSNTQIYDCKFCPFRVFRQKDRLLTHLSDHHTRRYQFCCSGTKQVKLIAALFDNDCCVRGKVCTDYLARIVGSVQCPHTVEELLKVCQTCTH